MNRTLKVGQTVQAETSGAACTVEQFLGGGGQGEVYRANLSGSSVALKWYIPSQATEEQRNALHHLIQIGSPNPRFLWPMELASAPEVTGFGYVMPLRPPEYHGIVSLMKNRIDPSFRALATAGRDLAHSFFQLHAKGLCYRDISFGNVFFDPANGDVLICDNDNVGVDRQTEARVFGTPRFMAPEIVRGEATPSTDTDLFSLAVLLFYMFLIHHPLEGKKEAAIRCFDLPAMNKIYGTEPVFIFDPNDESNRPEPGYQDNPLVYWKIYPLFLRDLFTRSFTDGLHDPQHGRVRESQWRGAMVRLTDAIIYCAHCGSENFYDGESLKASGGTPPPCWKCKQQLRLPPRIRIGKRHVVMLNHDTRLFPHHIDPSRSYDFSRPVAEVTRHPKDPNVWGLKNLSDSKWNSTVAETVKEVEPGRSVTLAVGTTINFGAIEGEIRM
ncbi:MAG: serine/threonine protein kinase [Chloroflexaceae bacterium]|nr:serine/threonine protein kinase [Chloroflexaceae bacterium]